MTDTSNTDAGTPAERSRILRALQQSEMRRDRAGLWVVALVLFLTLAYVTWQFVGTVVLGLFIYYVTRPVFKQVNRRIQRRLYAVVVTLTLVAIPVLFLVGWAIAIIINTLSQYLDAERQAELTALIAPYIDLTTVLQDSEETIRLLITDPSQLADSGLGDVLGQVTDVLLASLATLLNVSFHAFIALLIAFFLLKDDYRFVAWGRQTILRRDSPLEHYFRTVDADLRSIYFGNILNALATGLLGVVTYVVLNLFAPAPVRIPEPVLVGMLVGVGSLVPVIGMKIVWVPVAALLFARAALVAPEALWFPVVFSVVSIVVVDTIPDQLLRPYVSGRSLHIGAVILAYTFGPLLFGWYGIFLGPLILAVVYEFGRIVFPWLVDPTYEPRPAPVVKAEDPATEATDQPDSAAAPEGSESA
ncbi:MULTISPECIES: AI-2E family transporter [unclassified Haladaptatus]|uniref:AI-2E family transporter n=1 Tax=unclassified Haladaptatus TaxID=2622732 RepID=UPI0023E78D4F|nr:MULTISPECIES: AI-2E family transporter [unclassified Haladaptatus]